MQEEPRSKSCSLRRFQTDCGFEEAADESPWQDRIDRPVTGAHACARLCLSGAG
jgi:hypothetical protein